MKACKKGFWVTLLILRIYADQFWCKETRVLDPGGVDRDPTFNPRRTTLFSVPQGPGGDGFQSPFNSSENW